MKKKDLIKNYKSKIKNLKFHNDLYFNKDNPEISDQEYDKLKREIIDLENSHVFLKKGDPSQNHQTLFPQINGTTRL